MSQLAKYPKYAATDCVSDSTHPSVLAGLDLLEVATMVGDWCRLPWMLPGEASPLLLDEAMEALEEEENV